MHFLTTLTTLLAVGAGIASAAPSASPVNEIDLVVRSDGSEILEKCKEAGIDVHGPIPGDYLDYDKTTGRYHFGPGSKASLWASAQGYIEEPEDKHEKRQGWANIGIGMWAQDNCVGEGYWFDNVQYGYNNYGTLNLYSVQIKYRGLRSNEHLDFSRLSGSDWCGTYLYSAGQNVSQYFPALPSI